MYDDYSEGTKIKPAKLEETMRTTEKCCDISLTTSPLMRNASSSMLCTSTSIAVADATTMKMCILSNWALLVVLCKIWEVLIR